MILISNWVVPKGYRGITFFPFVFLKKKQYKGDIVLLNHEKIHLRQQLELLVIPFYFIYLIEFLIRYLRFNSWHLAYINISFEREAYANEQNLEYLKKRCFWRFTKYL